MNENIIEKLEEVSARIDTISRIILGMRFSFFENEVNVMEYKDLYNWHVANYELTNNMLWELSRSLEEQTQIIDNVTRELEKKGGK